MAVLGGFPKKLSEMESHGGVFRGILSARTLRGMREADQAEGEGEGQHSHSKGLHQSRGELWGWSGLSDLFHIEPKGPGLCAPIAAGLC